MFWKRESGFGIEKICSGLEKLGSGTEEFGFGIQKIGSGTEQIILALKNWYWDKKK